MEMIKLQDFIIFGYKDNTHVMWTNGVHPEFCSSYLNCLYTCVIRSTVNFETGHWWIPRQNCRADIHKILSDH